MLLVNAQLFKQRMNNKQLKITILQRLETQSRFPKKSNHMKKQKNKQSLKVEVKKVKYVLRIIHLSLQELF